MGIDRSEDKIRENASERHWGGWYLSKDKPLSLNVYPYANASPYQVLLRRINTEAKVLHWINHFLESKSWMEVQDIRHFMKACKALEREGVLPPVTEHEDEFWGY